MSAQAYIVFSSSSKELQARAGFDGWVMLLRDEFDTEDQAWPQEKLRLAGSAKRKLRKLEHGGVELDTLQLVYTANLLLEPPPLDREEERVWALEFFRTKMYDYVVRCAAQTSRHMLPVGRRPHAPPPRPAGLATPPDTRACACAEPHALRPRRALRRMTRSWSSG